MTKRSAKQPAAKSRQRAKKAKRDPVLATLANAILRECQKQSLNARISFLEADVAAEDAKLENLNASHVELAKLATSEEASIDALRKEGAVADAKCLLAAATATVNARRSALSRQQVAQKASQKDLAHAQAEKVTLEGAVKEFCFRPVTLDSNGHPEGMTLSLEIRDDSWLRALPGSGTHDSPAAHMPLLEALEKGIASNMCTLSAAVEAKTLVLGDCNVALQLAEEEHESSKAAENDAAAALNAAEKAIADREGALSKSRQAIAECVVQIEMARALCDKARMNLKAFQDGPLATFMAREAVAAGTLNDVASLQACSVGNKENSAPAAEVISKQGIVGEQQQQQQQQQQPALQHGLAERLF